MNKNSSPFLGAGIGAGLGYFLPKMLGSQNLGVNLLSALAGGAGGYAVGNHISSPGAVPQQTEQKTYDLVPEHTTEAATSPTENATATADKGVASNVKPTESKADPYTFRLAGTGDKGDIPLDNWKYLMARYIGLSGETPEDYPAFIDEHYPKGAYERWLNADQNEPLQAFISERYPDLDPLTRSLGQAFAESVYPDKQDVGATIFLENLIRSGTTLNDKDVLDTFRRKTHRMPISTGAIGRPQQGAAFDEFYDDDNYGTIGTYGLTRAWKQNQAGQLITDRAKLYSPVFRDWVRENINSPEAAVQLRDRLEEDKEFRSRLLEGLFQNLSDKAEADGTPLPEQRPKPDGLVPLFLSSLQGLNGKTASQCSPFLKRAFILGKDERNAIKPFIEAIQNAQSKDPEQAALDYINAGSDLSSKFKLFGMRDLDIMRGIRSNPILFPEDTRSNSSLHWVPNKTRIHYDDYYSGPLAAFLHHGALASTKLPVEVYEGLPQFLKARNFEVGTGPDPHDLLKYVNAESQKKLLPEFREYIGAQHPQLAAHYTSRLSSKGKAMQNANDPVHSYTSLLSAANVTDLGLRAGAGGILGGVAAHFLTDEDTKYRNWKRLGGAGLGALLLTLGTRPDLLRNPKLLY